MIRFVTSERTRRTGLSSRHRLSFQSAALGCVVAVALTVPPTNALADGGSASVPDPAASALFQAGRELIDRNNWKEGCSKFEASMILYPAASTLLNIARCYEHEGKLALAWSAYQRAIIINRETQGEERKKALEEVAQKGLAKIEPRLPRMKISLKGGLPSGLRISHNGKELPVALLGTTIPVDPGGQTVTADAPGFSVITRSVDASEGKLAEITLDFSEGGEAWRRGRVPLWAWISGSGGVVLLAGAAVFRADQAYIEGKQSGICGGDVQRGCPSKEFYAPNSDNNRKNLDNALFLGLGGVGVAALSVGIVGFVLGSSSTPSNGSTSAAAMIVPWVGREQLGAEIGGRF